MVPEKSSGKLDQIVARASRERVARDNSYRERALKMYPWVCGRCAREFDRENLRELTVHHRDHDHDNNPLDGSNWELLCVYCHDNEHSRLVDPGGADTNAAEQPGNVATYSPFANLAALMKEKK